jgi:hypothetical protein
VLACRERKGEAHLCFLVLWRTRGGLNCLCERVFVCVYIYIGLELRGKYWVFYDVCYTRLFDHHGFDFLSRPFDF